MPRHSRCFFCVGQFSGVQTRPIVVTHAPSPFSISLSRRRGSLARNAPLFAFLLSLSRSLFLSISFLLSISFSNSLALCASPLPFPVCPTRDLNMQSDFFPRRVGFFPCLVRRAHIITGWRENNGQKTARESGTRR